MSAFCLKDNSHSSSWKIAKMSSFLNIVMWYLVLSGIESRIQIFNKNAFLSISESLDIMLGERPLPQRQQSQQQLKNSQNVKFFKIFMWYLILTRIQSKIRTKKHTDYYFLYFAQIYVKFRGHKKGGFNVSVMFLHFYHVFNKFFYIFSIKFNFMLM